MTEPVASDELTQGVKDAQAKFDEGMGAVGDASPYPMLAELRSSAAVHRGWVDTFWKVLIGFGVMFGLLGVY